MAIRRSGGGLEGLDIEASQCVLPHEADCGDSVEGHGYPNTAQLRKLHSDMDVLDPKGGALGGYSFNSADTESARIYPDLPVQKAFILPLRDDPQTYSEGRSVNLGEVLRRPSTERGARHRPRTECDS